MTRHDFQSDLTQQITSFREDVNSKAADAKLQLEILRESINAGIDQALQETKSSIQQDMAQELETTADDLQGQLRPTKDHIRELQSMTSKSSS